MKALRVLGIILMLIGVVGAAALNLGSSYMLIAVGVRALSALMTASYITAGAGLVMFGGGTVPVVAGYFKKQNDNRLLESKREMDRKNFSEYARDSLNPEKTRLRLEQLRQNNLSLNDLIEECVVQLDRMDTYQSRQKSLIDANEAIYLSDTIEIIDESERRMCQNVRNIINCCILIEDTNGTIDDIDKETVDASLRDNEEELEAVSTLLKYSVAYINNYNKNGVSDRSELDAWLKVMQSSMGGK